MDRQTVTCLTTFEEFQEVRSEWERFTESHFPGNYSRTHAWLSAWWTTYHHKGPALVYIEKGEGGRIVAVAPLFVKKEFLGGLPILSLQSLGVGIGSDDFLTAPESRDFVAAVVADLAHNRKWHVAWLKRIRSEALCRELGSACATFSLSMIGADTNDYLIEFPVSYEEYLKTRSKKFRRNLRQAMNRLERDGEVSVQIFDPIADQERVISIGSEVAATSWQYKEGKSHFNDCGSANFYANLCRRIGGEEFVTLMVGERPVAYLLGCIRERTYYAVDTAYSADFRSVSAGRLLLGSIIERLIGEGHVNSLDFEGSGEYKDDYANSVRKTTLVTIYNRSLYPRLLRALRSSRVYAHLSALRHRGDHMKG